MDDAGDAPTIGRMPERNDLESRLTSKAKQIPDSLLARDEDLASVLAGIPPTAS